MSAPGESESEIPTPAPIEAASRPQAQHEFTSEQNGLMGDLGAKMQFVGMFSIVVGALVLLGGVLSATRGEYPIGTFVSGLLYVAFGSWTRSAGASFLSVVQTRGSDVTHLMDALGDVRRIYTLFTWIYLIAAALMLLALIAMVYLASFPPEIAPPDRTAALLNLRAACRLA